ncbi:hypothetical protein D3C76_1128960 [compost metagenome]
MQGQHPVELRVAGAEVVDGDPRTGFAVACHHLWQAQVAAAQLGDLEDHALRGDALLLQLLQAWQRLVGAQAADPARRDVQAEEPILGCLVNAGEGVVADLPVQLAQGRRTHLRVEEQRPDREQFAIGLA